MSIPILRGMLLWSFVINYAILMTWFAVYILGRRPFNRLLTSCLAITEEQCNLLNVLGMMAYKLGIALFNLVPYIALRIVAG